MIIFCAGLRSSGSTLQYQIVRHLIEHNNLGIGFVLNKGTSIEKYKNTSQMIAVKTHKMTQPDYIKNSDAKICMTVRDLRDQLCSLMQRQNYSFRGAFHRMLSYKDEQSQWLQFEDRIYTARYCDFVNDLKTEVLKLANHIEVPTDDTTTYKIAQLYSLPQNKKRLHKNHITDAKVGKYKTMLTADQIAEIENATSDWLHKYNYI